MTKYLQGLDRAQLWWMLSIEPVVSRELPDLYPYMTVGLVGDGSDCFGFDDQISTDHDSQTRVKIWLPEGAYSDLAVSRIQAATSHLSEGTISVESVAQFYRRYTGLDWSPQNWREWIAIPEKNLAAATNGDVFYDGGGRFSDRRQRLKDYYPDDVRLKLLESRILTMGQAGQYNYPRCLARGEVVGATLAKARFMEAAISAVFLLNRKYCPFYKWAGRALRDLPLLSEVSGYLEIIATDTGRQDAVESICEAVLGKLRLQGFTDLPTDFLVPHSAAVRGHISDSELREVNPWKL
ncbi:MAG: DUF4037 domain-containing protein [Actinomycetaceae bacterium]|nr:DUF4037 domain-containing protein [Actinomycetaceae bacterium]